MRVSVGAGACCNSARFTTETQWHRGAQRFNLRSRSLSYFIAPLRDSVSLCLCGESYERGAAAGGEARPHSQTLLGCLPRLLPPELRAKRIPFLSPHAVERGAHGH